MTVSTDPQSFMQPLCPLSLIVKLFGGRFKLFPAMLMSNKFRPYAYEFGCFTNGIVWSWLLLVIHLVSELQTAVERLIRLNKATREAVWHKPAELHHERSRIPIQSHNPSNDFLLNGNKIFRFKWATEPYVLNRYWWGFIRRQQGGSIQRVNFFGFINIAICDTIEAVPFKAMEWRLTRSIIAR